MAVEPGDRVDQLNYFATIQHDLEEARQGASEMHSSIERKREADKFYDPLQDRSALKVIRTRIDALQEHLDAHIAGSLEVNPGAQGIANDVYNLGTVIGDYLSEYLTEVNA